MAKWPAQDLPPKMRPDITIRVHNPERNSWIGPRFSEPARLQAPFLLCGEYWLVSSVDIDGDDLVAELVRA